MTPKQILIEFYHGFDADVAQEAINGASAMLRSGRARMHAVLVTEEEYRVARREANNLSVEFMINL